MWQFSQDGKDQTAGLIQQAGFNWAKHQVNWDAVELAPGQYDWTELDSIVGTLSKKNINVLLSLDQAPAFYRSASSGLMPSDPTSFGAFTKAMATRYKGKVQAYELWNEPNLARETGAGNVSPATYLPLLKAGAQGVKAADPSAMTILAAPSTTGSNIPGQVIDDISYLQQLYQLNGGEAKQYFDVVGVHPSGYSNPPDCNPDTPQCSLSGGFNNDPSFFAFHRVSQYRDVMTQNGDTGQEDLVHRVWLLLEPVTAGGLRVLLVTHRAEPGRLPGAGVPEGALARLRRRDDGLEPQFPACRAASR